MNVTVPVQPKPAAGPARPTLRVANFADHPQTATLESKFDLLPKNYEEWTHLWEKNPAYWELRSEFPIGWVLEASDGAIVGYLGNIPLNYEFQGRKLLAAVTRAWVVDVAYRSYALQLLREYFKQRNVDLLPNTSVNAVAGKAYGGVFRGGPAPVGAWDESLFWITNYKGFAESLVRGKSNRLAGPASYPLSAAMFLFDRFRGGGFQQPDKRGVIRCSCFDERFDAFWSSLRAKKSHMLLAVRSREALQWHFEYALREKTAWILAIEDRAGLAAYAVFNRRYRQAVGLVSMRLTDFQCLDEEKSPASLAAFLHAAAERCREESISMLEVIGLHPRFIAEIERTRPHRRELSNWRYFYKANDPWLAEQLRDPDVWDPWLFDGDSAL